MFWIDLEMTGLDEKVDTILEVAVAITDLELNVVEEYESVVSQPQTVLDNMNDWCKKHHGTSGLTKDVQTKGQLLEKIESEMIALCDRHFDKKDRIVICGNSISNDRRFIDKYLTEFTKHLHYRMIDVSSFKEIFKHKYSFDFKKSNAHRAKGDIIESINELKAYLSFVSVPPKS